VTTTSTSPPSSSSGPPGAVALGGTGARVLLTTRRDGDARPWGLDGRPDPDRVGALERLVDRPWTFAHQVHGAAVVVVAEPAGPLERDADALVSSSPGACLAVLGADCALVALASSDGVIGVAHAGWRGLVAGVLEATVATMRELGASDVVAGLGACIHVECYEFGADELDFVAGSLGAGVRGRTRAGRPALDLPAGVRRALARAGVDEVSELAGCTACSTEFYSHRARGETDRHALALWRADAPGPV